eukprot:TRINITY_DN827_c0_g2_i2.p1 TRINITY_DN827_c0_g2~~TRINITY_DN827_c0_g2_i2.p1  ORF type:complete len:216 (+),score=33.64 TRINITY_DN827_c0_g2_i2:24-671(+)
MCIRDRFRITDRLFTRIGTDDSVETNSSSFTVEMKEISFILQNVTAGSLTIIDELGRATSTTDGISLAWAISEKLLSGRGFSLLATHFPILYRLEELYPNTKNYHMVVRKDPNSNSKSYTSTFTLASGPVLEISYGIDIASAVGFPKSIISCAMEFHKTLSYNPHGNTDRSSTPTNNLQKTYELAQRLLSLKNCSLTHTGIKSFLEQLKSKYLIP